MAYNPIQKVLDQFNRKYENAANPRDEKMTLDKLAELLNVSKPTIISWKDEPKKIPVEKLITLSSISGISVDALLKDEDNFCKGPELDSTYSIKSGPIVQKIVEAEKAIAKLKLMEIIAQDSLFKEIRDKAVDDLDNIIDTAKFCNRKPRICAMGPSDAGKSSLGNYLLNKNILPTSYSPLTSVITYIHDITDKPTYLQGMDDAVVFGRPKDSNEKALPFDQYEDTAFSRNRWNKAGKSVEDYILRKGDYKSIVQAFGTREGAYYNNDDFIIDTVHLFVDCPFLKEVDYIDVPGYGSGDADDDIALTTKMYQSDVVFFLSQADSFLRGNDLTALANIISVHSSMGLQSMYILATHANGVGTPEAVEKIILNGMKRLVDTLTEQQMELMGICLDDCSNLTSRCFGFDLDNTVLCNKLNNDIKGLIPNLITDKVRNAIDCLNSACNDHVEQYCKATANLEEMLSGQKLNFSEIQEQREKANQEKKRVASKLKQSIRSHRECSVKSMRESYNSTINEDFILKKLEEKKVKNRKDSINDFASYLSNRLSDQLSWILKKHSEQFTEEVSKSITEYERLWTGVNMQKVRIRFEDFNFTNAFAAGLSGLTVYGALAVWASTVAAGSNLGAYILIAKVVSVLAALGIYSGGTATAAATVAAIGGPVVLGIAISVISAIGVWTALSGTWRVRLAKKILKTFNNEDTLKKYTDKISSYWDETEEAVDSCMNSLHDKTMKEFDNQIRMKESSEKSVLKGGLKKLYAKLITIYTCLKLEESEE